MWRDDMVDALMQLVRGVVHGEYVLRSVDLLQRRPIVTMRLLEWGLRL